MKIGIIGTGRIGTRLAEQIVLDGYCEELELWNRSKKKLEGTIQSLEIWRSLLPRKTRIGKLNWSKLNTIDLIVIALKEKYDPRELINEDAIPRWLPQNLRYVGFMKDLPLLKEICTRLRNYVGIVSVVTNPVDIMTSLATSWLGNSQVFGLGMSLDSARLSYRLLISKSIAINYINLLLGGEHGSHLIPLNSIWRSEYRFRAKSMLADLKEAQRIGFQIVERLGYTLQDCAFVFSDDIRWLAGRQLARRYACMSHQHTDACIGLPLKISNGRISSYFPNLNVREKTALNQVNDNIANLLEKIKNNVHNIYDLD